MQAQGTKTRAGNAGKMPAGGQVLQATECVEHYAPAVASFPYVMPVCHAVKNTLTNVQTILSV